MPHFTPFQCCSPGSMCHPQFGPCPFLPTSPTLCLQQLQLVGMVFPLCVQLSTGSREPDAKMASFPVWNNSQVFPQEMGSEILKEITQCHTHPLTQTLLLNKKPVSSDGLQTHFLLFPNVILLFPSQQYHILFQNSFHCSCFIYVHPSFASVPGTGPAFMNLLLFYFVISASVTLSKQVFQ